MGEQITLPNKWQPRQHQVGMWNYMARGGKRAVVVWHRRAGKDSTALNFTASQMFARVGTYWHMLPTVVQGRKVVWNGIDYQGRRMIDQVFPPEIRKRTNNNEMLIETLNGSMWQVCGSDNYNSLVGSNPVGVIFSEWSLADPAAWDFIRPILLENGGWAIFIYTPRGKNHGYRIYDMALGNDKWYSEISTIHDTRREDGSPIVTDEMIEEERASGIPQDLLDQEYFCSFEAGMAGAYYTEEMKHLEDEERICSSPWNPETAVMTVWDIGIGDMTVIGFFQECPETGRPILIDCIEDRNKGMDYYVSEVRAKPYSYAMHWGPHDIENKDWVTGKTRREVAMDLGFDFEVTPKLSLEDGVNATRRFLRQLTINRDKCQVVLDALYSYRREFNERLQIWSDKPVHDWASHGSDMVRYAAVNWRRGILSNDSGRRFGVKRII